MTQEHEIENQSNSNQNRANNQMDSNDSAKEERDSQTGPDSQKEETGRKKEKNKGKHKKSDKNNRTDKNEKKKLKEKEIDNKQEDAQIVQNEIIELGTTTLENSSKQHKIHLLSIIGEIEGHDNLGSTSKTTKYEHVLPQLAVIEDSDDIHGVLVLLNTVGGDVEAGLAIAEMIASLSKPTVSLVLGGSHSIGVPIAVSTDYSYIVPTGTMVIHPVRMNGTIIGVSQTFDYFKQIQNRIVSFVCNHCKIAPKNFEKLMMETGQLTKDVGTILVGAETVNAGIINEVGGISQGIAKLHEMINDKN